MTEACVECRKWEEHLYWSHTHGGNIRFIKHLAPENFSHRLSLPKKFASNIGGRLPEMIELMNPSGSVWNVSLKIVDGVIFLEDGWEEFAQAHYLEGGDTLIFTYKENSSFQVLVFDEHGCEKEHTYFVKNHDTNKMRRGKNVRNRDGQVTSTPRAGKLIPLHVPETQQCVGEETPKEMVPSLVVNNQNGILCSESSDSSKEGSTSLKEDSVFPVMNTGTCFYNSDIHCLEVRQEYPRQSFSTEPMKTSKRRNPSMELSDKALELASGAKLERPAFLSVMRPSHVSRRFVLVIPQKFVKKYLPSQNETFLIKDPQERSWKINYIACKRQCLFSKGWMEFAMGNKLLEGDVCVFELASDTANTIMKCHFFRAQRGMHLPEARTSSPSPKRIRTVEKQED